MTGILALDVDGTLTHDHDKIPHEVAQTLETLMGQGFDLIFITGRSYPRTRPMIPLSSPFYLAVQNGAQCFHVPSGTRIFDRFLDVALLPQLAAISEQEPTGMLVFDPGFDEDLCYYRRGDFSRDLFEYLQRRKHVFHETWREVDSFKDVPMTRFPALKYFGFLDSLERICGHMQIQGLKVDAPIIRDPFGEGYFVTQVTAGGVNKGDALRRFAASRNRSGPIIAAGDDYNDLSMLQAADIKIVIKNAPGALLEIADIVAETPDKLGIVEALKKAVS